MSGDAISNLFFNTAGGAGVNSYTNNDYGSAPRELSQEEKLRKNSIMYHAFAHGASAASHSILK